uniref:Uncharacterized protein n=1 Tax=Oryza barthii TaxID=65489 RepID=A0A0D3GFE5_9ORYZ
MPTPPDATPAPPGEAATSSPTASALPCRRRGDELLPTAPSDSRRCRSPRARAHRCPCPPPGAAEAEERTATPPPLVQMPSFSSPPGADAARPRPASARPCPVPPCSSLPGAGLPRVVARGGEDGNDSVARVCSSPPPPLRNRAAAPASALPRHCRGIEPPPLRNRAAAPASVLPRRRRRGIEPAAADHVDIGGRRAAATQAATRSSLACRVALSTTLLGTGHQWRCARLSMHGDVLSTNPQHCSITLHAEQR